MYKDTRSKPLGLLVDPSGKADFSLSTLFAIHNMDIAGMLFLFLVQMSKSSEDGTVDFSASYISTLFKCPREVADIIVCELTDSKNNVAKRAILERVSETKAVVKNLDLRKNKIYGVKDTVIPGVDLAKVNHGIRFGGEAAVYYYICELMKKVDKGSARTLIEGRTTAFMRYGKKKMS